MRRAGLNAPELPVMALIAVRVLPALLRLQQDARQFAPAWQHALEMDRMLQVAALRSLLGRTTIVAVSHRDRLLEAADHVVLLEAGRVAAAGTPRELAGRLGAGATPPGEPAGGFTGRSRTPGPPPARRSATSARWNRG